MRKLWPPNYDLFSAAIWALITSLLINGFMMAHDSWLWYPGLFGALVLTGKGFENSDGFYWPIAFWVSSITFYYLMAWPLVHAFPAGKKRRSAK
jgi:hypothetical protein